MIEMSRHKRQYLHRVVAFAIGLLFLMPQSSDAAVENGMLQFDILIDDRLDRLVVDVCFDPSNRPVTLIADEALAKRIQDVRATLMDGSSRNLVMRHRRIELSSIDASCVHYTVRLSERRKSTWRSGFNHLNGAVALGLDHFLLRPNSRTNRLKTRLKFSPIEQIKVLAPGKLRIAPNGAQIFDFQNRPTRWAGKIAFGKLTLSVLRVADVDVRIAIVGAVSPAVARKLQAWVASGLNALTSLYARIPVTDVQVLVFPLERSSDPVPWGEVTRGGADAVHLYVDTTRSLGELTNNWVLAHELSHLIHPYLTRSDAWFSEGVASYYQNVLRARAGLIEPQLAWQKLNAGFERGAAQASRADTLAKDTQAMLDKGRYMRVYWGGAAIAFIADVNFRQRSKGRVSLDSVFDRYSQCCLPSKQRMTALELMVALDTIAEMDVLVPLYKCYAMTSRFPDLTRSYQKLGITHHAGTLAFSEIPQAAYLRAAIMGK
ncbi:MAG: hypothetical protein ACI9BW_000608 [Gammaproteobacteria bacterium]|jgi:hypothetical protein